MNLLINLIPIKKGGGQQVAINFLKHLNVASEYGFNITVCFTNGTEVARILNSYSGTISKYGIKNNIISRLIFNLFSLKNILSKNQIICIYTLFGPRLPAFKNVVNIVGCAYSYIFYPEIDFWKDWGFTKRIKSRLIDRYRLAKTISADVIIFENEGMRQRAITLFNYPGNKTILIKPSLSSNFKKNNPVNSMALEKLSVLSHKKHFLLLTGWHVNKNIQALPDVAVELKRLNFEDVDFIITIDPSTPEAKSVMNEAKIKGVEQYIQFIGTFNSYELVDLYRVSYAVVLLSLLESFSNNIIEAWEMERPLLISNLEWAKSICNEAAAYVSRDNYNEVAIEMIKLSQDQEYYNRLVFEGNEEIKKYPSPSQKVHLQFEFIKTMLS